MDPGRKPASAPRVGRYEVLLRIASGGMATVYLARASGAAGFEREVALKVTHPHLAEDPELSRQLLEEAKLAVAIRHANVVPILDVGEEDGSLFLVMEYVEGDTLGGLLKAARGRSLGDSRGAREDASTPSPAALGLPPRIFLRILLDALAGLHAAHDLPDAEGRAQNLVHRDFSPQNILVGTDGIARLTDFGIAKVSSRKATSVGVVKGKINYMSPEQAMGGPIDRRTDVWAAGVIAWEAFAGRRLYQGADEFNTLAQIVKSDAPKLRTVNPDVHPAIEAAVAHALARDHEARTPTAASFAKELVAALRQASIDLAESSDVAAVVRDLAGAKLAERRRQAKRALSTSGPPSSTDGWVREPAAAAATAAPVSSQDAPASIAPPSSDTPPPSSAIPAPKSSSRPSSRAPARIALSQPPRPRPERTRSIRVGQSLPIDLQSLDAMLAPTPRARRSSRPTNDPPRADAADTSRRSPVGLATLLGMAFVVATIAVAAITRQIKRGRVTEVAASSLEPAVVSPPAPPVALPPSMPAPPTPAASTETPASSASAARAFRSPARPTPPAWRRPMKSPNTP